MLERAAQLADSNSQLAAINSANSGFKPKRLWRSGEAISPGQLGSGNRGMTSAVVPVAQGSADRLRALCRGTGAHPNAAADGEEGP